MSAPDPELGSYFAVSHMSLSLEEAPSSPLLQMRKLNQQRITGLSGLCLYGVEKAGIKLRSDT